MDIVTMLQNELKDKNWDLYTKARYLYLRSCELFNYDHRYYYADKSLISDIRNRQIDLTDVSDFRVVCESWSKQVYLPLLEMIGIKGRIEGEGRGHQFVTFMMGDKKITADACMDSDLSRVKMKFSTYGFHPDFKHYDHSVIKNIDCNVSYIDDDYSNVFLLKQVSSLEEDFQNDVHSSILAYDDDFLIYKLYKIKEMLESWSSLKEFSDCLFCISYLQNKFFDDRDLTMLSTFDLYNPETFDFDFIRLYQVRLINQFIYFSLMNTDDGYMFYEIPEQEAEYYKRNYMQNKIKKVH